MYAEDPAFWRAGAISSTLVMLIVLVFLTVDSLATIHAGGATFPPTPSSTKRSVTSSTGTHIATGR